MNNYNFNDFNSYVFKNKKDMINQFYSILELEANRLKTQIIENKNWLQKQPVMQDFLNNLQYMLQEKNIGFFSSLVTALANDVISTNEENVKTINFDLSIKNSMPALKINAKTFENNIEKITSGGLKNVIATGLRVLALWRLTANEENMSHKGDFSHRKFLFLDEPDCWIGNQSMPNYAKLLYQLAEHFNIQILVVTHKDLSYFKPYAKVYQINNIDGCANIDLLSEVNIDEDSLNNEEYIKSFNLQNFKVFKDTTIRLSPKLTVIVGKSDTGKSVIMEAFNALVNNQSDDDVIRHFEKKASLNLNLINKDGKEYNILWERVKKTNSEYPQKVRYRLYENHNLLNDEFDSFNTPEFISKTLKMKKMDGIDIHLGVQDDMTFLFNPRISDQERAKILSLGKETAYIHKMMDKLKSKTRELKTNLKINEDRYNLIRENIINLSEIDKDNEIYNKLKAQEQLISNNKEQINTIEKLILTMNKQIQMLEVEKHIKPIIKVNNYKIHDIDKIDDFINQMHTHSNLITINNKINLNNIKNYSEYNDKIIDNINNIKKIDVIINKNKEFMNLKDFFNINLNLNKYEFKDLSKIDKTGVNLKKMLEEINKLEEEKKDTISKQKQIKEEMLKIKENIHESFEECPLCGSKI